MSEEMTAVKPSADEVTESLNGFDEIAIEKAFGKPLTELSDTMAARALVFVLRRRDGMDDKDARREVMQMALGVVMDSFAEEGDTEGKDEPEPERTSTPTS